MFSLGHFNVLLAYPLIPWIGVMALGYCLGGIYTNDFDAKKRKDILLSLGLGSIVLFVILRSINVYGNQIPWTNQSSFDFNLLSFINVTKYPPSLDYLLITEGFAMIFLAITEKVSNGLSRAISVSYTHLRAHETDSYLVCRL